MKVHVSNTVSGCFVVEIASVTLKTAHTGENTVQISCIIILAFILHPCHTTTHYRHFRASCAAVYTYSVMSQIARTGQTGFIL